MVGPWAHAYAIAGHASGVSEERQGGSNRWARFKRQARCSPWSVSGWHPIPESFQS